MQGKRLYRKTMDEWMDRKKDPTECFMQEGDI